VLAIGLAFIHPRYSLFMYVLVPLFYIVGGPIDKIMARQRIHHDGTVILDAE
jgi:hypothetical protein